VPTYPIEPDKLLATADVLAPPNIGRGRPAYTSHRRATSTAYYALFHAITNRIVDGVFENAPDEFKQRVRRWIAHREIAEVCRWISALRGTGGYPVPKGIRSLLISPGGVAQIDASTVAIADAFLELYEKRLEADYDHSSVFTRADTRGHIALARQAVGLVEQANSPAVQTFFGLIAMRAKPYVR
jgi:hypothetical protein